MMRWSILVILLTLSTISNAQELDCKVQVTAPQVQGTNQQVYKTLQSAIFEFMNNTKWTKQMYKLEERIECNIRIQISERVSADIFTASVQIQVNRPVYKSSYSTPIFNYSDNDFKFQYLENTPIEYTPSQHRANLSSVMAFYAYMILGFDADTFAEEGGTAHFLTAKSIVNNAQNAAEKGWKAFEGKKNRYWLVENILHATFRPLRQCNYRYHRLGFDKMYDDVNGGLAEVTTSIEGLRKLHRAKPLSFNMQLFFTAKSDEIVNLYSQAQPQDKTRISNILKEIDPANLGKYQRIAKGN